MGELRVTRYKDTAIRTVWREGCRWFSLLDVCAVLQMSSEATAAACDEKAVRRIPLDEAGTSASAILSIREEAVWTLCTHAGQPTGANFRHWIADHFANCDEETEEEEPLVDGRALAALEGGATEPVVPLALLKYIMDDPDVWIKLLETIKAERAAKHSLVDPSRREPPVCTSDSGGAQHA